MSELLKGFDASIVDEKASKAGPAGIDIAYQRLDNIAGKVRPIGRCKRGAFLSFEIIMHDQFVAVFREDEINTGALVIPGK